MSTRTEGAGHRRVFDRLAPDYYDEVKHPTTASFRAGSDHLLRAWLGPLMRSTTVVCEVGAGKSSVLQLIREGCSPPARLLLVDFSFGMLRHSAAGPRFTHLILGDAERLPLKSGTVDVLVAPLGAPFNGEAFWQEAGRVVRAGRHVIYTGPAHEWALRFRDGVPVAEYRANDALLRVPSWTRSQRDQRQLIAKAGFELVEEGRVGLSGLGHVALSPELAVTGEQDPIVSGVLVKRSSG